MKKVEEQLLREHIRNIICEDFGGYGGGYGDFALGDFTSPMGNAQMSSSGLHNIFIKPFTDVFKQAAGSAKEISRTVQNVVQVFLASIATAIVPIFDAEYEKIEKKYKADMDEIKKQYAQIYNDSWDAIKHDDVLCSAFLLKPDLMLTAKVAKEAPKAVSSLLNILSGGRLEKYLPKGANKSGSSKSASSFEIGQGSIGNGMMFDYFGENAKFGDSVLTEAATGDVLTKLVQNSKVHDVIRQNSTVQEMSRKAAQAHKSALTQIYNDAKSALNVRTAMDIAKRLGKPEIQKQAEKLQGNDKVDDATVETFKKGVKQYYLGHIDGIIKHAIEKGVPEQHPFITSYKNLRDMITKL